MLEDRHVLMITGGARSGKSSYAENRASALGPKLLYIATAKALDPEMAERIEQHRKRRGGNWLTIEEPFAVARVLHEHTREMDCVVIDCLTLWMSNLFIHRGEEGLENELKLLVDGIPECRAPLILVTNEVGSGIVPDYALGRRFRDLAGWTNQRIAQAADEVVLMVAGIPVVIKPREQPCS